MLFIVNLPVLLRLFSSCHTSGVWFFTSAITWSMEKTLKWVMVSGPWYTAFWDDNLPICGSKQGERAEEATCSCCWATCLSNSSIRFLEPDLLIVNIEHQSSILSFKIIRGRTWCVCDLFWPKNMFCPTMCTQATRRVWKCCGNSLWHFEILWWKLSHRIFPSMFKLDFLYILYFPVCWSWSIPLLQPPSFIRFHCYMYTSLCTVCKFYLYILPNVMM